MTPRRFWTTFGIIASIVLLPWIFILFMQVRKCHDGVPGGPLTVGSDPSSPGSMDWWCPAPKRPTIPSGGGVPV